MNFLSSRAAVSDLSAGVLFEVERGERLISDKMDSSVSKRRPIWAYNAEIFQLTRLEPCDLTTGQAPRTMIIVAVCSWIVSLYSQEECSSSPMESECVVNPK